MYIMRVAARRRPTKPATRKLVEQSELLGILLSSIPLVYTSSLGTGISSSICEFCYHLPPLSYRYSLSLSPERPPPSHEPAAWGYLHGQCHPPGTSLITETVFPKNTWWEILPGTRSARLPHSLTHRSTFDNLPSLSAIHHRRTLGSHSPGSPSNQHLNLPPRTMPIFIRLVSNQNPYQWIG